ncbi:hypothetical protein F5878DRAFT_665668 [Lentinula raphanica]|uniref:Uncharacterized protein n=1 Tax=Lentinula raphanica TaxID=153919 RepID=A0AA38U892_9AGAR|nr:hypothetical protein F5880DRAFT_1617428 [Lentinula raphanica]KAJ3833415.1 hypothetical protein F5878DRAFT_665668 [Lentinula raphanica]
MSQLPQELIDRLVDEFQDDCTNLKVLSLVGRSWLPRARYHLFRSLTLTPQDLQAMRDNYADLKRRASLPFVLDPDDYVSLQDRKLLCSPLAENPQPTQSFLSSITNTLPYVQGLRLLSFVLVGNRRIYPREYFQGWLGYGGDEYASRCRLRWKSSSDEDFREMQKARWNAVDLPWGRRAGLHVLPFRNLKFLYIQWSVLSWTPPSESTPANPYDWPSYQLAKLINSNANTLDHLYIDEYPGFQFKQSNAGLNGDGLLDLLAMNASNLQSLCLGGLREAYYPQFHLVQPEGSNDFLSFSRALYPSGEEVPYVMLGDNGLAKRFSAAPLKRLHLQGFDSEATVLIEDAIFNRGVFSLQSLTHLALTVMPVAYNYMFMFSKVQGTLTHLTLDLKDSSLYSELRLHFLPKLECLQIIIHAIYPTWTNFHTIIESLSDNCYHLNESSPAVQVVQLLHISFGPSRLLPNQAYLLSASVDELLQNLVCVPPKIPDFTGRSRVETVTFDLEETVLADSLPITYSTGHLKEGTLDNWWLRPSYLR